MQNMVYRLKSYQNGVHGHFFLKVAETLERQQEEIETLKGVNKIIVAGQTEDQPGPWVQRSFDALAHALALSELIKEASDYLDTNNLTSIAHGSIIHQKFKENLKSESV